MFTQDGFAQDEQTRCQKGLWHLIWEYAPFGLVVMDIDLHVQCVNPAFCQFFSLKPEDIIGYPISIFLDNTESWKRVWKNDRVMQQQTQEYPKHNLYVNQIIFPIAEADLIICLMFNMSHDLERQREHTKLRQETIKKVNEVVDNQMKVVQEIAGLLGETTAETKVSLLKIIQMLETDS